LTREDIFVVVGNEIAMQREGLRRSIGSHQSIKRENDGDTKCKEKNRLRYEIIYSHELGYIITSVKKQIKINEYLCPLFFLFLCSSPSL